MDILRIVRQALLRRCPRTAASDDRREPGQAPDRHRRGAAGARIAARRPSAHRARQERSLRPHRLQRSKAPADQRRSPGRPSGADHHASVPGGGLYALEVKNNATVHPGDLTGLRSFVRDYPEATPILLYRGRRVLERDILCLPSDTFLRSHPGAVVLGGDLRRLRRLHRALLDAEFQPRPASPASWPIRLSSRRVRSHSSVRWPKSADIGRMMRSAEFSETRHGVVGRDSATIAPLGRGCSRYRPVGGGASANSRSRGS